MIGSALFVRYTHHNRIRHKGASLLACPSYHTLRKPSKELNIALYFHMQKLPHSHFCSGVSETWRLELPSPRETPYDRQCLFVTQDIRRRRRLEVLTGGLRKKETNSQAC